MKNRMKIQRITGISILIALAIVLTFISNYIPTGNVNINLTLIVIALGAFLYGPLAGMLLGFINGAITIIAPNTLAFFFPVNPLATILLCLLKTGLAGLVAGFIFKLLKNKYQYLGAIIGGLLIPIINTGLFLVGVFLFFTSVYQMPALEIMTLIFSINFLIEFITIFLLTPTIYLIIKVIKRKMEENNIGEDA